VDGELPGIDALPGTVRFGKPYSWNNRVKTGFAPSTAVDGKAWQPRRYRLNPSATVNGLRIPAIVVTQSDGS
jgi:hypothetical protein